MILMVRDYLEVRLVSLGRETKSNLTSTALGSEIARTDEV
jgi:hypothetical protein